jgi:hypothetical protein
MENILDKLDLFIRKFHLTLLIKNIIFFTLFILLLVLFFSFVEYSLWLDTFTRKLLFILAILSILSFGVLFLLLPFLNIKRFSKKIDRYIAADIIGKYFPEISDKFRNLLELNDISNVSRENTQLLQAAILQKTSNIGLFKIQKANDTSRLKKAFYFFIPVFVSFVTLTFISPDFIVSPLSRIVQFDTQFEKPAPFHFHLLNDEMEAMQGDDITFVLQFSGEKIPAKAEIIINDNAFLMQNMSSNEHRYTVNQLTNSFTFRFKANGYFSETYNFKVFSKPSILAFTAEIFYPPYTGKQNEIKKNSTDFVVPQGTKIRWTFQSKNVKNLQLITDKEKQNLKKVLSQDGFYEFSQTMMNNQIFAFTANNNFIESSDTLKMFVDVIPDTYPSITTEETMDTVYISRMYFTGVIGDDYGFSHLGFHIKSSTEEDFKRIDLPHTQQLSEQRFFYFYDFSQHENWRSENFEYYFSVSDNDGVQGAKTSKTQNRTFTFPDADKLENVLDQKKDNITSDMAKAMQDAKQIKAEIDQLRLDMMNKKSFSWEDKLRFEMLMQKQTDLENLLEQVKESNFEKNVFEKQLKDISPELLEKQLQLQEMMDKLFSDEMKEMMQKLQEMLQELNKDKIMEQMEKMQMRTEDLEKRLDENLQLMMQLEFEKKMEDLLDQLNSLSEKQETLQKETQNNEKSKEELQKEQQKINESFESIKEEIQDLKEMNEKLHDPMDFPETDDLSEDISEDLDNAENSISKGNNKKAGESQKSGAQKMKEMSDMLQQAMDSHNEESLEEDIENLKMILKNLVHISFAQERNIDLGKTLGPRDPRYNQVLLNQSRIMSRFKIVEDSLHALAKRQIMIQPLINNDLNTIRDNASKIDMYLNHGALAAAMTHQQYLMKSVNNLALLLIEAMKEMNDMMMQAQGSGSCSSKSKKPKGKKPGQGTSAKTMRQLQEQLNQQMESLMKSMQDGKTGEGGINMSEQMAKMAAEQEAIRKMLQEYSDQLKSMGELDSKILNELMQQMEQTEKDLVNKRFDLQMMKRQNDIVVRLMESEKAELEREKDENRTSRTGKVINKSNPEDFFKYKRNTTTTEEIIKSIPPVFNNFYRQKVNKFYLELNN